MAKRKSRSEMGLLNTLQAGCDEEADQEWQTSSRQRQLRLDGPAPRRLPGPRGMPEDPPGRGDVRN